MTSKRSKQVVSRLIQAALAVGVGALTLASAHAHQVWVEKNGDGAKVYYGEYAEGVLEVAGGELDKIATPVVFGTDKAKPLTVKREKDHLAVTGVTGDVRVVEEGLAPYPGRQGKTKYIFAGKSGRTETKAASDCEIVPVSANGNEFQVVLHGKGVAKAKVTVVTGDKWSKTFVSDDSGKVTVVTPGKGLFVLEATVPEAKAGGEGDKAYARTVHVVTTSFVVE